MLYKQTNTNKTVFGFDSEFTIHSLKLGKVQIEIGRRTLNHLYKLVGAFKIKCELGVHFLFFMTNCISSNSDRFFAKN